MLALFSVILVLPVYVTPARDCRVALDGGSVSTGEEVTKVPWKSGTTLPQFVRYPGVPDETSMESVAVRPKVGVPQVRMSSLVWNGPATTSLSANWIAVQKELRPCRDQTWQLSLAHWIAASLP